MDSRLGIKKLEGNEGNQQLFRRERILNEQNHMERDRKGRELKEKRSMEGGELGMYDGHWDGSSQGAGRCIC